MATAITRALVINVGVFQADNNIRRNIGAYSLNYQSPTNAVTQQVADIAPGQSLTFNSTNKATTLTMLRCTTQVALQYTLNVIAITRPAPLTVNAIANSFFMVDDNVGSFTVTNNGTATTTINFVQG